jgi:4-phospho-D-threonate 3-dehydrogenase / 4-phospho-D-erythronate 3-dehydrogenase
LPESQITLPQLGITTGDPAGIGPEISLQAAQEECFRSICRMVLFGSWDVLKSRAAELGIPFPFERISPAILQGGGSLPMRGIVDIPAEGIVAGTGSKASGEAAAQNILECTAACLRGPLDAMVTAPINKIFFKEAGYPFPGHTEFLAHLANAPEIAMAFLTERLKVVLATIHEPIKAVVGMLSPELIYRKLSIILKEFPRLGLPCKRVAVAGLNPHAGESGILGTEDQESILPGILRARTMFPGATIEGPLPGDTLFYRAYNGEFDVVLAMYHDQGLAPIKLIGFGESVNVTLGLPFIRTSVDHGTAYELAGKGSARHDSMNSAIRWAIRLADFEKSSRL